MRRFLSIALIIILCFVLFACDADDGKDGGKSSKKTTTTTATATPTTTEPAKPEMTAAKAAQIVDKLIEMDNQYSMFGICCDMEYVEGDMSEFLSYEQEQNYFNCQYKLTCCDSIPQVMEHITKYMDDDLVTYFPSEDFFTDDEGNLYLTVVPMGFEWYMGDPEIKEFSNNKIIAEVILYEWDEPIGCYNYTIINDGDGFVILDIEWKETY